MVESPIYGNKMYNVIVSEPLGASLHYYTELLASVQKQNPHFPMSVIRKVGKNVLFALKYLHEEVQCIHHGSHFFV